MNLSLHAALLVFLSAPAGTSSVAANLIGTHSADSSPGRAVTLARFPTPNSPGTVTVPRKFYGSRRRTMVMRKTPSPKQKKVIVKHMVKDAKKLRSAYAKGKKKKFQAAFGRLSAAMIDVDPKGGT
jgi:hypothetical protein